ncbi:MAG: OmpA family protein [Cyclobacteriaceae bacterium]|nr:OmpA family protein [Cyclobacteriaceae bacterium]
MKYFYTLTLIIFSFSVFAQNPIELISVGSKINTGYHEAAPIISSDGTKLYFFVTNHPDNTYGKDGSQDIWFSERINKGEWGDPVHLPKPLNGHHSNQVFTIFLDGKTLFIRGGKSKNSKGFSFAHKSGDSWTSIEEIKVNDFKKMNNGRFYGASMDSDKKVMILYFSEKENSAISDLYISKLQSDGSWSSPAKLGSPINTGRDEFAPFIAPDNETMYYSSSRKDIGIGGADIYKTKRLDDTWMNWSKPINMKAPINTKGFDAYFSVDAEGNIFTTSSGRQIDGGSLDIFTLKPKDPELKLISVVSDEETHETIITQVQFKAEKKGIDTTLTTSDDGSFILLLKRKGNYIVSMESNGFEPKNQSISIPPFEEDTTMIFDFTLKPIPAKSFISVTVYDKKTKEKIDAEISYRFNNNSIPEIVNTNEGYFEAEIEQKGKYVFDVNAQGYINTSDSIDISTLSDPIFANTDIYLTPIEIGTTVRLEHIYFDFDRATLKEESFKELNKVVKFMEDNETITIEIGGHTDSKGSEEYNQRLSQERAESVMNYLFENGIYNERVSAMGYGESQPETTNETDEGRAINRRVVFTITSK